jgi:hypothetical protein
VADVNEAKGVTAFVWPLIVDALSCEDLGTIGLPGSALEDEHSVEPPFRVQDPPSTRTCSIGMNNKV